MPHRRKKNDADIDALHERAAQIKAKSERIIAELGKLLREIEAVKQGGTKPNTPRKS